MIGEIINLAVVIVTLCLLLDFFTRKAPKKYAGEEACGYCVILCIWFFIAACLLIIGFSLIQSGL